MGVPSLSGKGGRFTISLEGTPIFKHFPFGGFAALCTSHGLEMQVTVT
jgi:hypothetical protein